MEEDPRRAVEGSLPTSSRRWPSTWMTRLPRPRQPPVKPGGPVAVRPHDRLVDRRSRRRRLGDRLPQRRLLRPASG